MSKQLFSVNAASEILERDRRVITRAVRGVKADGHEGKRPVWSLPSILAALEASEPRQQHVTTNLDAQVEALYQEFESIVTKVKAEPTLEKRRAAAIRLVPRAITEFITVYRARDAACRLDEDHADLRSDRMNFTMLLYFKGPCQWNTDETWQYLQRCEDVENDEAAA
jgi:hypothetical protein